MKIVSWLIGCVNDAIHWSFAPKDYKDRCKAICNGDYYITDQKMFKSQNKWNDGQVPSRDLDDIDELCNIHIGDIIGRAKGDGACQIKILGFIGNNIHAKVVSCEKFWTDLNAYKNCRGWVVGEEIELEFRDNINGFVRWNVVEPADAPWFCLYLDADGVKSFEHYR